MAIKNVEIRDPNGNYTDILHPITGTDAVLSTDGTEDNLDTVIGTRSNLTTTDKSSIVNAINEVNNKEIPSPENYGRYNQNFGFLNSETENINLDDKSISLISGQTTGVATKNIEISNKSASWGNLKIDIKNLNGDNDVRVDISYGGLRSAVLENTEDFSAQTTSGMGVAISDDGTKFFVLGRSEKAIFEYSLSTPYDISTKVYVDSFSVAGQATSLPDRFIFSDSGSKLFLLDSNIDTIFQYSLSTAYDISTMSYDNKSLLTTSVDNSPYTIAVNNNGTKLYLYGYQNNAIQTYSMTANDISTAVNISEIFSFDSLRDFAFNNDGSIIYIEDGNQVMHQRSLTTFFDITTINSFDDSSTIIDTSLNHGLAFNSLYNAFYIGSLNSNGNVYQYSLPSDNTITEIFNNTSQNGIQIIDLSAINIDIYLKLQITYTLNRNTTSIISPIVNIPSITWEGKGIQNLLSEQGEYIGDGTTNRILSGIGINPTVVILNNSSIITSVGDDSFTVTGTDNTNNTVYKYVALGGI